MIGLAWASNRLADHRSQAARTTYDATDSATEADNTTYWSKIFVSPFFIYLSQSNLKPCMATGFPGT